jgi:hypothetical protein
MEKVIKTERINAAMATAPGSRRAESVIRFKLSKKTPHFYIGYETRSLTAISQSTYMGVSPFNVVASFTPNQ